MLALRISLLLVIGCVLSCQTLFNYLDPDGPRYHGEYARRTPPNRDEIKVVSYNVKFGEAAEAAARELATAPLAGAGIILLQEMDEAGVDLIARSLSMNYVYYPASVHSNGRNFGNAVLSAWPILSDAKLILPHKNPTNAQRRIAVRALIDLGDGTLTAYSVHTETVWLGLSSRLDQARAVASDTLGADGPVVVGGDFNTSDPGSVDQTRALFEARGFDWATSSVGETQQDGPLGGALDHIFTRGLWPVGSGKLSETNTSDHLAIWIQALVR